MKAIIINLFKGFWLAKVKFLLCTVAAVLSAWGIGVVVYSYILSERDFQENFAKTNQVHIVITVSDSSGAVLQNLTKDPDVQLVEQREVFAGRIRNKKGSWMSLLVHASTDFENPQINKYIIVEGKLDSANEVFIEKNGINFLDVADRRLIMDFAGHGNQEFRFSGLVHDPGLPPSQMEQTVYAFTSIANVRHILGNNRKSYLVKTKLDNPTISQLKPIGQRFDELAKSLGSNKNQVVIPPPGEHPHQNIVDSLALLQKGFGVILGSLGVILLSLILITWLYPQIANIGIMKAIGASTTMIARGYFVALFSIVFLGLILGLPLGYKTAKFYSGFIAGVQNFEAIKRPIDLVYHLIVIIPAIAIPMLFAFIPLRKASRASVHNALSKIFYTPHKRIFFSTQLLSNVKLKYGVNNLFRSNQRTFLMLVLMIIGIALYTAGTNLEYSLRSDFNNYVLRSGYDVTVSLKDTLNDRLQYLDTLPFVKNISYVNRMGVRFRSPHKSNEENASLKTFSSDYNLNPEYLIKGSLDRNCEDCLYFSQQYLTDFEGIVPGESIELSMPNGQTKTFKFAGVIKDIGYRGFYRFQAQPASSYKEIAIKTAGIGIEDALRNLDDIFLDQEVDVLQISDPKTRLAQLDNHLQPTYGTIQYLGLGTMILAMAGMLIVLNISMQERAREMGIMKALGASVGSIVKLFSYEHLISTSFAIVIGCILGQIINSIICALFGVMVIEVPVVPLVDYKALAVSIVILVLIQFLMIEIYGRFKVRKTSAGLLSQVF